MISMQQQNELSKLIANIEQKTDGELVTVVAKRSDSYYEFTLLWATLLSLSLPGLLLLSPLWLNINEMILLQLIVFMVLSLLFSVPAITYLLIPKSIKHKRAASLATNQFIKRGVHQTRDGTGILIFVSEAERYVEIIADYGINQKINQSQWDDIVKQFTADVKRGETFKGFETCVKACGDILVQHVPATQSKNELSNKLVMM